VTHEEKIKAAQDTIKSAAEDAIMFVEQDANLPIYANLPICGRFILTSGGFKVTIEVDDMSGE
jgi:hypothetical protein